MRIVGVKIEIRHWNFLSEKEEYKQILRKIKKLYVTNSSFKKRVNEIVKQNRKYLKEEMINLQANYVLEELASIFDKAYD